MALAGGARPFLVMLLAAAMSCCCVAATAARAQTPANGKSATPAPKKVTPAPNAAQSQKPQQRASSIAAPPPASLAPLKPVPPVDTSIPPPSLPRASRERMRACAEEWGKMKMAAKGGLPMWREFATGCLTRR